MIVKSDRKEQHHENAGSMKKLTKTQKNGLAAMASLPEEQGWVRNPLYRPVTRPITIRMNAPDIALAQQISKTKGLPDQTYIKILLHEALERELAAASASRSKPVKNKRLP